MKDRHSKVCTAKGPRDRRVRLSAHTAIQFYDVQDRLGYDRPSKAVDWLISKAKSAIDELDELPPWKPVASIGNGKTHVAGDERSSLLTDTPAAVQFDVSRSQDLKLSLQSYESPNTEAEEQQQSQFGFENQTGWEEPQPPDLSRFQRLISWNLAGGGGFSGNGGGSSGGFMLMPPSEHPAQFFSQRGTLQSNNTPLVRACINGENSDTNYHHHQAFSDQPMTFSGIGFASSSGGFRVPARIQGDHHHQEEEQDGEKPSSVASNFRH